MLSIFSEASDFGFHPFSDDTIIFSVIGIPAIALFRCFFIFNEHRVFIYDHFPMSFLLL